MRGSWRGAGGEECEAGVDQHEASHLKSPAQAPQRVQAREWAVCCALDDDN